jgi:hypothetical protein
VMHLLKIMLKANGRCGVPQGSVIGKGGDTHGAIQRGGQRARRDRGDRGRIGLIGVATSETKVAVPVRFAPGRLRLATRPDATGGHRLNPLGRPSHKLLRTSQKSLNPAGAHCSFARAKVSDAVETT